jgi:deoxyribodipyrimidine photo-lyase
MRSVKTGDGISNQRIRAVNRAEVRGEGDFVLYWMTTQRRLVWNFALERAIAWAEELRKPIVALEALRADYPWASERFHTFVVAGMADQAQAARGTPIHYYPFVEPSRGAGKGLLETLSAHSALVVTDEPTAFFLPRMLAAAAERVPVRMEAVDGNGIIPVRAPGRAFSSAHHFRRFAHGFLGENGIALPAADPLKQVALPRARIPEEVLERWPATRLGVAQRRALVSSLPIDHGVVAVKEVAGGARAGAELLESFVDADLAGYAEERNHPDAQRTSGLSPYLHFGHVSAHQVVDAVLRRGDWHPGRIQPKQRGKRSGWWGLDADAESFLDEAVTWREVSLNTAVHVAHPHRFGTLPAWAQQTLIEHDEDRRKHVYTRRQFEGSTTHDPVWNAAQRELVETGRIHGYLRMLWGKKILEWSHKPRGALAAMLELNDKYALDGRDANSVAGIMWILGRYDRPWPPERPIFGRVRFMSSASTLRKLRLRAYLERFGGRPALGVV